MNVLYIMDGCSVCAQAMHHLNQKEIEYKLVNILEENSARKDLKDLIGEVHTPVLVNDKGIWKGGEILEV
ncbi:glutaredoxin family protein [Halobacillus sp. K22]|uniref:glutaredoxin family protein n=1 Tax=Halobacillus sp. K22 TaxID=3457431 RepID=UPI003FCE2E17